MKKQLLFSVLATASLIAGAAQAQRFETQEIYQRLGQVERDMNLLQRQVAQGGGAVGGGASAVPQNLGQISVEIARIDEELRNLRGQVEQANYQAEQAKKDMEKLQKDMDYRFQALEDKVNAGGGMAAAVTAESDGTEPEPAPAVKNDELPKDLSGELETVVRGQPEGSLSIPKANAPMSARDLYNHAFKLLNQTDYKGAETAFRQFTKQYGDDPLVGNAWYWLGEAFYVQRDYVKAADSFRQGYTKVPEGPKAGDNLLKLAMSLSALERTPEACVVLKQVDKKFSTNSEALRNKTRQEISRLSCK